MATIVWQQGSQPCLDSQLVEPRTTLRLKLSSQIIPQQHFKPTFPTIEPSQKCHYGHNNDQAAAKTGVNSYDKGGWSFLQSLANCSQSSKFDKEATLYVHPLNKHASSTILSDRSLELCTENLGNETGTTDTADCGILSNIWYADATKPDYGSETTPPRRDEEEVGQRLAAKKAKSAARSFPPPLTTMSGRESLQVRPHREDGRLIIKAVITPSKLSSCFRADRSEGRLRLCFLENYAPPFDSEEEKESESCENDTQEEEGGGGEEEEEEEETKEVGVEVEEEEEQGVGESEKEKGEMGIMEKFGRARGGRCKEGGEKYIVENKSMLKPFWVAT